MRVALYSDIHSNLEALLAVLEDIQGQRVDKKVCLGDIVGYGADPNDCTQMVKANADICIAGNHDFAALDRISTYHFNSLAKTAITWTQQVLNDSSNAYLASLPLVRRLDSALLVHAGPCEPEKWVYITTLELAAESFDCFKEQTCFVGHTHIPYIIGQKKGGEAYVSKIMECKLKPKQRYLINIGSVGQPRDRDPRASYAICDLNANTVEIRRVRYDVKKAQNKMRKAELPEYLINRIAEGR